MSIEYNDIELDLIIKDMTKHIEFNINEYESSMATMRKVEKTYWQYCCHQPYYPRHTFSQYFKRVCNIFNEEWNYLKYNELKTKYNYYKKNIPTAGAMIHYHTNDGKILMLLVKNTRAKVYSLPKGKQEKNESIQDTAIREVKEETGIDISSYINSDIMLCSSDYSDLDNSINEDDESRPSMDRYYICKSVIYDVQLVEKIDNFSDYDNEEIEEICWKDTDEILQFPHLFSRQVKTACSILRDKYLLII